MFTKKYKLYYREAFAMKKFIFQLKNKMNNRSKNDIAPVSSSTTTTPKNQPVDTNTRRVRMIVEGTVQGVGFRYTTKQVADSIGVFGIVRNENDGTVYIEANGEVEKIDAFIEAIRKSPSPSANVQHVTIEEDSTIEQRIKFSITN